MGVLRPSWVPDEPAKANDELPLEEIVGPIAEEATPALKSGRAEDSWAADLTARAEEFRKSCDSELPDPALVEMFGDLTSPAGALVREADPVALELEDRAFVKRRSEAGPARDRLLRSLAGFIRSSAALGTTLDELCEYAADEDELLAIDLREAAKLAA
jgi:hypothetical protein